VGKIKKKPSRMSRPTHIDFGAKGEDLAITWLISNGYTILHRNWHFQRTEVDIIAVLDGIYHFIEVKSRRSKNFGPPEGGVTKIKLRNIMRAATAWLYQKGLRNARPQYDVLAITILPNHPPEFFFIKDVSL
jgi:putative endonuclease